VPVVYIVRKPAGPAGSEKTLDGYRIDTRISTVAHIDAHVFSWSIYIIYVIVYSMCIYIYLSLSLPPSLALSVSLSPHLHTSSWLKLNERIKNVLFFLFIITHTHIYIFYSLQLNAYDGVLQQPTRCLNRFGRVSSLK
jgi:hypothetical protein